MRRISVLKSPTCQPSERARASIQPHLAHGRRPAASPIESLPARPISKSLAEANLSRKWKDAFLAYFDTDGASNGQQKPSTDIRPWRTA